MKRILTALLALTLSLSACASTKTASADTWQEQYDLGVRYLSEGNYEEAIIAFTAAIEIDPKRPDAYIGRGDAYVMKAEAISDSIQATYDTYQLALKDYEQAILLGFDSLGEKQASTRATLDLLAKELDAQVLLAPIFDCLVNNDLESAKSLMRQDQYQALSKGLKEHHLLYRSDRDRVLALYKNNCYYFGQWQDNQRNGYGLWIKAVYSEGATLESQTYEGQWANDLPNGSGTKIDNYTDAAVAPFGEAPTQVVVSGSFLNALEHGTMRITYRMSSGSVATWDNITSVDGIRQTINATDTAPDGEYLIAHNEQAGSLYDEGQPYTIFGF